MNSNKTELLANGGKHFGSESKGAICPRALCQQFSHITLSTTSLWSRHGSSSKARSERRPGTETVGAERCNLSLASALMWAKAIYSSSRPLWKNQLFCPIGGTPCKKRLLRKIMPIFHSNNFLNLTMPSMYCACLWKVLNVHHEACSCQCTLSLDWCCRLFTIITASVITEWV